MKQQLDPRFEASLIGALDKNKTRLALPRIALRATREGHMLLEKPICGRWEGSERSLASIAIITYCKEKQNYFLRGCTRF